MRKCASTVTCSRLAATSAPAAPEDDGKPEAIIERPQQVGVRKGGFDPRDLFAAWPADPGKNRMRQFRLTLILADPWGSGKSDLGIGTETHMFWSATQG